MQSITIKICTVSIFIERVFYDSTITRLRPFVTQEEASFRLQYSFRQVEDELFDLQTIFPNKLYSLPDAEYNLIYREISAYLWSQKIVVFHGVLMNVDEESGVLITAPSGTGKTTHALLWKAMFKDRITIINGDKPILRLDTDGLWGYGSPWQGKERIGNNSYVKIKAICYLMRDENNSISKCSMDGVSLQWLLEQTMVKDRESQIINLIAWYREALKYVNLYTIKANTSINAAKIAYLGIENELIQ